jgi:hypothetical protein
VSANAGGGFIDVGDSLANATISNSAVTTIGGNLVAGRDVRVASAAYEYGNTKSNTDGGGAISFADGQSTLNVAHTSKVVISGRLFADRTVLANASHGVGLTNSSTGRGGGLGVDAEANDSSSEGTFITGTTQVKLLPTARVLGENVYLWATEYDINSSSGGIVQIAEVDRAVLGYRAYQHAYSKGSALGGDSDAEAHIGVTELIEVWLDSTTGNAAEITADDRADLRALTRSYSLEVSATAKCSCGFGDGEALVDIDYDSMSRISGRDETIVRTAYLWGQTDNAVSRKYYVKATGGIGIPDADVEIDRTRRRMVFWESTVILLGEPNPVLKIASDGTIAAKTRNVYVKAYNPATDTYSGLLDVGDQIPSGRWIVVGDLIYDETGKIHFEANDAPENSEILGNAGEVQIKHTWDHVTITNLSDRRLVVNDIDVVLLETNPIEEVAFDHKWNNAMTFPDAFADPSTPVTSNRWPGRSLTTKTYDFDITHKFAPTQVVISVEGPGNASDMWLDGDIENPIGRTEITNSRGGIFSDNASDLHNIESTGVDGNFVAIFGRPGPDTDYELIRTNRFFIDAVGGSVGRQNGPRVPIAVEMIRFLHIDPEYYPFAYNEGPACQATDATCLFDIQVQGQATDDLVMDITSNERSLPSQPTDVDWQIDYLIAGDDVDVVINDTIQGDDEADLNGLDVALYTPPSGLGAPAAGTPSPNPPIEYLYHFRPDLPVVDYGDILRAFGITERVKVTSTYTFGDAGSTFGDVRAGDDIKVCHVASRNYNSASDFDSAPVYPCDTRNPEALSYAPAASTATVNFWVYTDVAASLTSDGLDDGIGTDVQQIFLFTNGFIVNQELAGDLLAGHIESTEDNVILFSPKRILDADSQVTIDVTAVTIVMYAGTELGVGGIGLPTDYLEINVDRNNGTVGTSDLGVLFAYDYLSDDAQTLGVYLDELVNDMKVDTVWTEGTGGTTTADLATGNVSLRTINGSIVDARNWGNGDTLTNVYGQTIDIDANGGSIGQFDTGLGIDNDLEIDSSRGSTFTCTKEDCADLDSGHSNPGLTNEGSYATDDVGLEATHDIYLTETDGYLRLVLAHAVNGDIRITVRETTPDATPSADTLDEDLYLLKAGTARFAESNTRAPSFNDPDAVRSVPKGQVFAESGSITLLVGDDVTTHQNSEILADESIDIRGDHGNADLFHGTDMILRGRIIADCVVVKGEDSGHPVGTCTPTTAPPNPDRLIQIWGHNDIDSFQLGDRSGITGGTTAGDGMPTTADDGYIFLGARTYIRGGNDLIPTGDGLHLPSIFDGEDVFTVWYLQSMNVLAAPAQLADVSRNAGHSLTLDGQADTDYYKVYTTGSHGSVRNYMINVLDTGASDDGVDELDIFGIDNLSPDFNGYVPGTVERNKTDDIFLLRAVKCLDTVGPYGVSDPDDGVPTTCTGDIESANHPAFVALLHGNDSEDGGLGGYQSREVGDEASNDVQRVNYDAALNGRLAVYGLGGNDAFFSDDNSAITTLDGGAGFDKFQIGQIFGSKRNSEPLAAPSGEPFETGGALLPHDTFPVLVATTRGWLSPGIHAPLVANGGTGNDEFVVYSNQAELRLEGHDDNDLFVVRAFALAAVCDTSTTGPGGVDDGVCTFDDINLEADPNTLRYPVDLDPDGPGPLLPDGVCTDAENPGYGGDGWNGYWKDNNGDGTCNKADAHITGAKTFTPKKDADPNMWEDDVIPLDADGVARPIIGLGFSTARPLDIRAGGGEDEVSYNVNAPVSVDGGAGFDKLIVLGTEFADDFAITRKAIYGAGLNVRYTTIEVVEIDGLEGDDEFFVVSTAFGVAYRVIGGLGSDTINVAGDVVEDIVTRELEGVSGTIDHRVISDLPGFDDPFYDGLSVDGLDYNLATPDIGQVIIGDEGPEGTSIREGGSATVGEIDSYSVKLAADPGTFVYVTVSVARSPQEEADDSFSNPEPTPTSDSLSDGEADTIWLCTPSAGIDCSLPEHFQRHKVVNGIPVDENGRALVLTFTGGPGGNWNTRQWVYVYAVDDDRSEGDRVVVVQHSTISANPDFDQVAVRNVEVSLRDNDTPGVYVTEVEPGSFDEDRNTLVIEGFDFGGTDTGRTDDLVVQLQKDPGAVTVRVKVVMDAESQRQVQLSSADARFQKWVYNGDGDPLRAFTYYTIDFDSTDWDVPLVIEVSARPDADSEDPFTAAIYFVRDDIAATNDYSCLPGTLDDLSDLDDVDYADCDIDSGKTNDPPPNESYVFPNIRSGPGRVAATVIDDETADVISIETGVDTVVQKCGNTDCTVAGDTDSYTLRLTKRPELLNDDDHSESPIYVDVAVLTGGLTDVVSIGGTTITPAGYAVVGGLVPSQRFFGNLTISGTTIARANGSDLGSFHEEGFQDGDHLRIRLNGGTYEAKIAADGTTEKALTVTWIGAAPADGTYQDAAISTLHTKGTFTGTISDIEEPEQDAFGNWEGWTLVRDEGSFLADGFLEGMWIEVCELDLLGNCTGMSGRFKIQVIRGTNKTKDNKLELRYLRDPLGPAPSAAFFDDLSGFNTGTYTINRIAPLAHFDDTNWYVEQEVVLEADVAFRVPIARDGVKIFPVNTHGLWKLQGPLAVEGGVTGADRSLKLGVKLPGEADAPLIKIGTQPPESKQIDVLNIFNDGSKQNRTGTLTSTHLTGLGMAKDLDFGPNFSTGNAQTFGEPVVFPGGIGFGTVQFVDGTFSSDGAKSTIEVVNLLLGIGNDHLDIQGTIDPDVPVKLTGTIIIEPRAAGELGTEDLGGIDLTRPEPFDWKAQGFLVGQPVKITGFPGLEWHVVGFSDDDPTDTTDNTRMHLADVELTQEQIDAAEYEVFVSVDFVGSDTFTVAGTALTRNDGGNWLVDGVTTGKTITVNGAGPFLVTGMFDADTDGLFEKIVLDSAPLADGTYTGTVEVIVRIVTAGDVLVADTAPITIEGGDYGGYLTRHDGEDWADYGFVPGQQVRIQGIDGAWRLLDILDGPEGVGTVLWLTRGEELLDLTEQSTRMVYWPGPHGGLTVVHGGGNSQLKINFEMDTTAASSPATLTRLDGRSWIDTGFSIGDRVRVGGFGITTWTVVGFGNAGCPFNDPFPGCGLDTTMQLEEIRTGTTPATDLITNTTDTKRAVWVAEAGMVSTDPKVVFGAPDTFDVVGLNVTRNDGGNWLTNGFAVGRSVMVNGEGPFVIVNIVDGGATLVLDVAPVLQGLGIFGTVQAKPAEFNVTVQPFGPLGLPTTTLTCETAGCFGGTSQDGTTFEADMEIFISGVAGPFTVVTADPDFLVLQGAALQPTYYIDQETHATVQTPVDLTVWGYDVDFDGGVRIGGDRIVVCNLSEDADEPCRGEGGTEAIAGPDSPLVVYGDTSQDAVWYSGESDSVKGHEFGPKPYDPFWKIPEQENEDDEWLFPLANKYLFAGNDIIDASGLFADVLCDETSCDLPSVGFTAYGGEMDDTIIGSQAGDHLAGGSGDDLILGLRGADHIYGDGGINVDILTRGLTIEYVNRAPAPTLDPRPLPDDDILLAILDPTIKPGDFTLAPLPAFNRDLMVAGDDVIFGEGSHSYYVGRTLVEVATSYDTSVIMELGWPQHAYDDIIHADHGVIEQQTADTNEPETRLQKIQTTTIASVRYIESRAFQNGGDDQVNGNEGRDVIVGGTGDDMLDGDQQDDMVFGDNIFLSRRVVGEDDFPEATDWAGTVIISHERFQALCGEMLYSRSDRVDEFGNDECGNQVFGDTSGVLLTDGTAQDFRDPDSPGIDLWPWWAEYLIEFDNDDTDGDYFHHDLVQLSIDDPDNLNAKGAGSFGNDYLAGGADHDLIFGQMGDDIVQGDGGIEDAVAAVSHVGASRSPDGCVFTTGWVCDYVGDLDVVPSFEAASDGEDYIEGNAGSDILLGNLGQDDIVGGNSDFFSLDLVAERPDHDDLLFGGAATQIDRDGDNDPADYDRPTDGSPSDQQHSRDADTLVGDNGNIIRIVGTNRIDGLDRNDETTSNYVTFNYDTFGPIDEYSLTLPIVVRGVHLLDYTPGGLDYDPASAVDDIGDADEFHGETGDDTAYGGKGNDVFFGDAGDDDLIGGAGHDWFSGGTGDDGILGDDGRIFTSRNSSRYDEPLYGILRLRAESEDDPKRNDGDVLNELISTPGDVQVEVINIEDQLKKTFDITPYNLSPRGSGDDPLFRPLHADDIMYGGLGRDFLHGASGDDAISGAEALSDAYGQEYDLNFADPTVLDLVGVVRSDWTRPYNIGRMLMFGDDTDPWNAPKPIRSRLGEFALYDEYDPRRVIRLNPDGTKVSNGSDGFEWLMNFVSTEGPASMGCVEFLPNGTCVTLAGRWSDGDDVGFGDLGNDWIVGGTGEDNTYGGWGNDLLNADDVLGTTVNAVECSAPEPNTVPLTCGGDTDEAPDTHVSYQDRAYGGAGLDVLIGNTGGDRLIDWVGEFNSYIVPFAPFGIATVSRQVPPHLFSFLYQVSLSDGVDPTRWSDDGGDPARNGEPHGELGLVTQKDKGLWQDQTGGPSDPQPGNIPGGRRDVVKSSDWNDGALDFAPDSGVFTVLHGSLRVAAESIGLDAAAVVYLDAYLPRYYEISARLSSDKPIQGWKANSYLIFDYYGPDDFKFAGIDISNDKIVMGEKVGPDWIVRAQKPVQVKPDVWYDVLVAVNGTTVTVVVDGETAFTYAFDTRLIDDEVYDLNTGLIGFGSDNAKGRIDDFKVQLLPPLLTLDRTEDFSDGVADWIGGTGNETGTWAVAAGAYTGTPASAATSRIDLGSDLGFDAYLDLEAVIKAGSGRAGFVFDWYAEDDYKFVVYDPSAVGQEIQVGHVAHNGTKIDGTFEKIAGLDDHRLKIILSGALLNILFDGSTVGGWGFNAPIVDGKFGLLADDVPGTFDDVRVRTNDDAFDEYDPTGLLVSINDGSVVEGDVGNATVELTISLAQVSEEEITINWVTGPASATDGIDYVTASGQAVFAPGEITKVITLEVIGDMDVEGDEAFRVQIEVASGNALIDDGLGIVTIVDDDFLVLPVVTVTVDDPNGAEAGSDVIEFTIGRSDPTGALAVDVAFGGPALLDTDYIVTAAGGTWDGAGTVTFVDGIAAVTLTLTPVDDAWVEGPEDVTLTLLPGAGYDVGAPASDSGTIADNDAAAATTLSIGDESVIEGDKGGIWLDVTVTRGGDTAGATTVDWATVPGTATADVDYKTASGTIAFGAGETTMTIKVRIYNDKSDENDEFFTVVLSNAVGATITDDTAAITITDNDGALFAAASPVISTPGISLLIAQADSLVTAATSLWTAAGADTSLLTGVTIEMADLPSTMVARVDGSTIYLDSTAAGWGWFVDTTPLDSSEFGTVRARTLVAAGESIAAGRIDLLTVLVHEIGHILGVGHSHTGVMAGTIGAGRRALLGHRFTGEFRVD